MKNNSDFEQPIFDNFKELTEEELMQTSGGYNYSANDVLRWLNGHRGLGNFHANNHNPYGNGGTPND
ncbi:MULTISPECIES: bacteriocin [Lactococcus]|uniref:bacteriocin n=1 Tax=Lactococcus TaxID=1357 RepID=UPI0021A3D0AE|nr:MULTISPECIES: bacteriocin [Lactococcus]MDM7654668.1 bacteriocin [Lactococcus cremoris]